MNTVTPAHMIHRQPNIFNRKQLKTANYQDDRRKKSDTYIQKIQVA